MPNSKVATRICCAAATLLGSMAANAAGNVPYTPTTDLSPPITVSGTTLDLSMINDNKMGPGDLNGFAVIANSGSIKFEFASPQNFATFKIWNNIIVDEYGGAEKISLTFLDQNGNDIGGGFGPTTIKNDDAGAISIPVTAQNAQYAQLFIESAYPYAGQPQVEIREIEFLGAVKQSYSDKNCEELRRHNMLTKLTIKHKIPEPRKGAIVIGAGKSYAVGKPRGYDDSSMDNIFIDSFPLVPEGKTVCDAHVLASGRTPASESKDSINTYIADHNGMIVKGGKWTSRPQVVESYVPGGFNPLPAGGNWTYKWWINSQTPGIGSALLNGPNSIDVHAQDDTNVGSVVVDYWVY